jgi:tetratricopeptide (TPR) repeat protein
MFQIIRILQFRLVIFITLIEALLPLTAAGFDYSNWSYDDLRQTACEFAGDKNYKGALEFFDKAVHAAPNNPEAYINRGAMFEIMHESDKAIQDEKHAVDLASGSSKSDLEARCLAHQNLAGIYKNNKQLVIAETEARIAVELCPYDPDAQKTLADVLANNNKITEALPYYIKAKAAYERSKRLEQAAKVNKTILQMQSKSSPTK